MHSIASISRRVEASKTINHRDRASASALRRRPSRNSIVQGHNSSSAGGASAWIHGRDLRNENAHGAFGRTHLVDQCGKGIQDGARGNVAPDVIGGELHHHDIWLRDCEPSWKLVIGYNSRGKVSSVAVVLAVIGDTATLARKCADKVGVSYASSLEFLVEKSSPTAL